MYPVSVVTGKVDLKTLVDLTIKWELDRELKKIDLKGKDQKSLIHDLCVRKVEIEDA